MTSITPISATDFSVKDGGNYQSMRGIATSADGTIIYISLNSVPNSAVIKSTDSGATWNIVYPQTKGFTSIACSSDGVIVYAASLGEGLCKTTDAGANWSNVNFSPNNNLPGGSLNPESATGGQFPGYALTNIYQIACDSTGTKLIMTTNAAASIYQSINGGVTWSFIYVIPGYATNPQGPTSIASNFDGTVLYAALNNTTNKNIIVSKDSGVSWASINMLGVLGPFGTISTNSYGDFVYTVSSNSTLVVFYPTYADTALLVASSGNTFVAVATYNSGNNIIISQNNYMTITNGAVVLYSVVNKYTPGQAVPCFKSGSKILCLKENVEVYVMIQDIRKGDLVKTINNGYIAVCMIGKRELYHTISKKRIVDQLYKCSQTEYPEVFEDLVITGGHSILVNQFTDKNQKEHVIEVNGDIYITDNKLRVPACTDLRASIYEDQGIYTIYHLALENDNHTMNYGIYANGLLVETSAICYLKDSSKMTLIE